MYVCVCLYGCMYVCVFVCLYVCIVVKIKQSYDQISMNADKTEELLWEYA